MSRLNELHRAGTSPWLDFIQRDMLENGSLADRIKNGQVFGVTSNPSIFAKAFTSSTLYDTSLQAYLREHPEASITDLYEHEAIKDIQAAADLLRPVYDASDTYDGYVSFEVSPHLANDTEATLVQARRLFQHIARPNLMIKIPATQEGIPAIRQCIREGININATLMFSLEHYHAVAEAFIGGLEDRQADGQSLNGVASVASMFVSRIDRAIQSLLPARSPLRLNVAILHSRLVYECFQKLFFSPRFCALKDKGAQMQRVLWASTGMKDPDGRDVLYVESLIGSHTVNTIPQDTMEAFEDHGDVRMTIADDLEAADNLFPELAKLGIRFADIAEKLQTNGVQSFTAAYEDLLQTVAQKRDHVLA